MAQTDKPFDVRVVNSLERPTINDFNLAQEASRTTAQLLAQTMWDNVEYGGTSGVGFCGNGFRVARASGFNLVLRGGIGFVRKTTGITAENIEGITGLNISAFVPTYPLYLSQGRVFPINAAHALLARRDIIAVRSLRFGELVDSVGTDIFNPTMQNFTPVIKQKTYTWCLDDSDIETLPVGGAPTATAPLIYIPGTLQPYSQPNDFLTMALPVLPAEYTILAIVNVPPSVTEIYDYNICDYRQLIFPNRSLSFPLSFIGGSEAGISGQLMTDYNEPQMPGGLPTPILSRTGLGTSNRYALTFPGFFNARSIVATLSAGGAVYDGNSAQHTYANFVTTTGITVPQVGTFNPIVAQARLTEADTVALADPSVSTPATQYAVGQPYCQVAFALGIVDLAIPGANYQSTYFDNQGGTSRLLSGTVTIGY